MVRDTFKLTLLNLVSRITGFIREIAFARVFGASIYSDAFLAAFKIPNLLRSIFAEGAASNAFLPVLGESDKKGYFNEFVTLATLVLSSLSTLVALIMFSFPDFFVRVFAPGLNQQTLTLASKSLRILSVFVICMTLTLIANNILNYQKKFGLAALIQIALNLSVAVVLAANIGSLEPPLHVLNLTILFFSAATIICIMIWLKRFFTAVETQRMIPLLRRFMKFFIIGLLISSVYQIIVFASTFTASYFEPGSISILNYADRVYQVPHGILGVSFAQVSLSYVVSMNDEDRVRFLKRAFYFASRVGFLSAGLILALADIIVKLFFGAGLDDSQISKTAGVLRNLTYGLPFAIIGLVLSRHLYAIGQHKKNLFAIGVQAFTFVTLCLTTFYLDFKPFSVTNWFPETSSQIEALAICISISVAAHFILTGLLTMGGAFIGAFLDLFWPFLAAAIGIFSVISVDLSDFSLIGQLVIYSIVYTVSFVIIFFVEFIGRKF